MEYKFIESENTCLPVIADIPEGYSLKKFQGCCGYYFEDKFIEFDLYTPWAEDKDEFPDFKLKNKNLLFFRYSTKATRAGRMIPVIAIDAKSGKLHFPEDTKDDKKIKLTYLNLWSKRSA